MLRSPNNFWGGVNQQAWYMDDVNNQLVPATVVGLGASVSAYVPAISPDGKHYAFTNGDGESRIRHTAQFAQRDGPRDRHDEQHAHILEPAACCSTTGPAGGREVRQFPARPNYLVFQQGANYCASYGEMLPSWDTTCGEYSFAG